MLRSVTAIYLLAAALMVKSREARAEQAPEPPLAPSAPSAPESAAPAASRVSAKVDYVLEDGAVFALAEGARTRLAIDPPVVAIHRTRSLLYVARGWRGVAIYELRDALAPTLLRDLPWVGGNATGFHGSDDQVWVVVGSQTAIPLGELGGAGSAAPRASASAAPPRPKPAEDSTPSRRAAPAPIGLHAISPGSVELTIGTEAGVRIGDRYAIVRPTRIGATQGEHFVGEEVVTLAEVVAVSELSSLAQLGRSIQVEPGDFARRVKQSETERGGIYPSVPRVGEVSVVLRPLVNVGAPLGVGLLADVGATYWGQAHFLGVHVQPLGLGITADGNVVSTAALLEGGYEAPFFAVGLGLGLAWVNGDLDYMLDSFSSSSQAANDTVGTTPTIVQHQETHTALALAQVVRLGARDGLNLKLNNLLLLHKNAEEGDTGFIYGGTTARFTAPTGKRTDFFAEGGGGVMGYWFLGIGMGSWLVGNGSPGSWYLSVSAGAAGIRGSREITEYLPGQSTPWSYTAEVSIAGPMVSVGVARRFGF
jgi:hypothetical protein